MLYSSALTIHTAAMGVALLLLVAREPLLLLGRPGPAKLALVAARAVGVLMGAGVLAGIVLVFAGGWSLLTPWLVLSLILIGAMSLVDSKLVGPWDERVRSALRSDIASPSVKELVRDRRALAARLSVVATFAVVAGLMAAKPELF